MDEERMAPETIALLHDARAAEKRQALFYRALASVAEAENVPDLSERLNGMHADEQHHLSRLTVRLVELDEAVPDPRAEPRLAASLHGWEEAARAREEEEIARYAVLLGHELDGKTRHMIEQFLDAERRHARELGGKWMGAEPW
jgi:rubrerythrin